MAHRLPTEINPGSMRHRVRIAKPSGTQDSMGGVSQDPSLWEVVRTCWASIEAFTGQQSLAAGQFVSTASHWITMRHPKVASVVPTAGMYVWWNQRTFQIEAVLNPTEQTKLLVLVCTEINDSRQQIPS
jgi:SPP1 family predicted phage head-tail adaptor